MINTRSLTCSLLVTVAAFFYLAPAYGADAPARAAAAAPATGEVLTKLHASNQKEIASAKLGEKSAKSKDVVAYAKTLIKDHTQADKKVMAFAKKHKIDLATTAAGATDLEKKDTEHLADAAKGEQFDKHFVQMMLEDHQKTIAEVSQAHDATTDAKLKELLAELLPTLEKHRDTAQKLLQSTR